ncbi:MULTISPECIES: OmpA family protein [unclassified Bradyrhizobium]|uniref:OmpA family protein n=1 Tax=unclassified Bradyrhizobium TaxID=2631580 RepID=UPI00247AEB46|nr:MULTISPECIES: OmpA family protein [unclassified Bradyrhizobium]WGS20422.1 OmpA family protein [Bradyrhizobium sp. ISRA463]WGS27303.1 OmpA family protein [Bradyrhizobium sp. ISRA464]
MAAAAGQNREIEQLKTLLFQPEATRLQSLEADLTSLQQYVGSADRLEAATADILVAALERAEVNRPRELANAIAPTVVSAIRSEIRNSRELMVEALYPIVGRLVSAAVANSFREMVAALEQRINSLTSTQLWVGRIKSLVTGRPISEFVLADNPPRVNRLLIIERGNGRLVADWKRDETPDERADLLSAMVAAILEFSVQALAGEGNLQTLDFGGRQIALRASPRFILAAECLGPLRPADNARINSLFFDSIERIDRGANCDAPMLASLAASIETDDTPRKATGRRGKIILFGLLAAAAAMLVWFAAVSVTRSLLERRTYAALEQLAAKQPLLTTFPLRLDFDHHSRSVAVSGIEPSQLETAPLIDALAAAAAPYRVVDRIGLVSAPEQLAASQAGISSLQQSLARLQASVDQMREAMTEQSKSGDQKSAALSAQYDKLADQHAKLGEQYAALQSVVDGPAARLDRFIASTAVFFANNSNEFLDNDQAEQQIRQLAGLLANNDLRVRIVGYADQSGTEGTNRTLARKRAEQVARRLTALGIDPSRLILVSRAATMPITDRIDTTVGGNRRVSFENVYRTEVAH